MLMYKKKRGRPENRRKKEEASKDGRETFVTG